MDGRMLSPPSTPGLPRDMHMHAAYWYVAWGILLASTTRLTVSGLSVAHAWGEFSASVALRNVHSDLHAMQHASGRNSPDLVEAALAQDLVRQCAQQ